MGKMESWPVSDTLPAGWQAELHRLEAELSDEASWKQPALEAMRSGTLTNQQLRQLMVQYYHFTERFVGWIALIVARAGDEIRRLLLPNLVDEVTDPVYGRSHRDLLEDLLSAVGVTPAERVASRPSPATERAAKHFWELGLEGRIVENLFALGPGTEAISYRFLDPMEQAIRIRFGLRDEALQYFEVHRPSVEDLHAAAIDRAIIAALESVPEGDRLMLWDAGVASANRAVREHRRVFEEVPLGGEA